MCHSQLLLWQQSLIKKTSRRKANPDFSTRITLLSLFIKNLTFYWRGGLLLLNQVLRLELFPPQVERNIYLTHSTFCRLDVATSMGGGGGYNWIMVISLVYTPLSLGWSARGKQHWENCPSSRAACNEARSGSVLQGKGLLMKVQSVCDQKRDAVLHHH